MILVAKTSTKDSNRVIYAYWVQYNLLSLSLMLTLVVCNLSVTAVSKVARVTLKDLSFSTIRSSRMSMVTTWAGIESLKVRLVVTAS